MILKDSRQDRTEEDDPGFPGSKKERGEDSKEIKMKRQRNLQEC